MPSAARRRKQKEAKARQAATHDGVVAGNIGTQIDGDELLQDGPMLFSPASEETLTEFKDFYIGEPTEEAQTQTETTTPCETNLLDLMRRVEMLETTLNPDTGENSADDNGDLAWIDDDDYDDESEEEDPRISPQLRMEINYLNSLGPEELRQALETDDFIETDEEVDTSVGNSWFNSMD